MCPCGRPFPPSDSDRRSAPDAILSRAASALLIRGIAFAVAVLVAAVALSGARVDVILVAAEGEDEYYHYLHHHHHHDHDHVDDGRYEHATAALFVRAAKDDRASGRLRMPPSAGALLAVRDDHLPSKFDQRTSSSSSSYFGPWPQLVRAGGESRFGGDGGGGGGRAADRVDDRFERARTLMRVEYERISALEVDGATVDPSVVATSSHHVVAAPPLSPLQPPLPATGADQPHHPPTSPSTLVFNFSTTPFDAVNRSSLEAGGGVWTGEMLFVCGAAALLLAVTGAAVGFANRRRSNRQSYPCWERQLRNGLASPRAL